MVYNINKGLKYEIELINPIRSPLFMDSINIMKISKDIQYTENLDLNEIYSIIGCGIIYSYTLFKTFDFSRLEKSSYLMNTSYFHKQYENESDGEYHHRMFSKNRRIPKEIHNEVIYEYTKEIKEKIQKYNEEMDDEETKCLNLDENKLELTAVEQNALKIAILLLGGNENIKCHGWKICIEEDW